jgi:acetoin utilization protein AcuB
MKAMLKVKEQMTPMPISVRPDVLINEAWGLMRQKEVRHLPVEENGVFIGIVSERSLRLASSYEGSDKMTVRDVMANKPFKVDPEAPLFAVALQMAEHRFGSAVVIENNRAVGIFTTVDALRLLGEILQEAAKKVA